MSLNKNDYNYNDSTDNLKEPINIENVNQTISNPIIEIEPNLNNNKFCNSNKEITIIKTSSSNNNPNQNNNNPNNFPSIKKKKSQSKLDTIVYKEVDVILDLYTKVLKKEDAEKCLCRNNIPEDDDIEKLNNKNIFYEREIISNLNFLVHQNDKLKLSDIITKLKVCGYPLTGAMISIYSKLAEEYIFVGADPIDQNFFISNSEYNLKLIKLRVVAYLEDKLIKEFSDENISNEETISRKNSLLNKKKNKRTKERKIGYIIEKVNSWRKLYNGFHDDNGKFTKYSLDEAAKIIGISKKSLDDYLLQLRLGRKFGFDYNLNKNQKVGILRSFVKQNRNQKND